MEVPDATEAPAAPRTASSAAFWLASSLFLVSGFCGLTYEVLWFKRFSYLWGSSSLAMAAVVASFLCGLGLGAWRFGALADRAARPLKLYGVFELAIGALALLVPFATNWLEAAAAPLYAALAGQPLVLALARFGLTFVVIGPACIAMGATLPFLTRELASRGVALGTSTAWLYAFNALGAALGAWLTGFHLLPALGLDGVNLIAVVLNVAVGIAALTLVKQREDVAPREELAASSTAHTATPRVPLRVLYVAAALTGFASLVLQMLWTRQLAVVVGGTTYAFSATLFVFILGLALGALWFRFRASNARSLEGAVSMAALLVVVPTLIGLWALPDLAIIAGQVQEQRSGQLFNALFCCTVSAVLQGLPTIGMGLLFPSLVALTGLDATHAGRAVGRVYALNTLGSIVGSGVAALVLLPALGSFWTFRLALVVYAALPALLWRTRSVALATSILALAVLFSNWRAPDPMATNLGLFMYGPGALEAARATMKPVYFEEGAGCNVLVLESDEPTVVSGRTIDHLVNVRVNGKIDASNAEDMVTQLGIAYMPRFLRPRAKDVLVIGVGSGTTIGASALFPDTRVTACELEPAIVEATRYFEPYNHSPTKLANVEIVLEDGRGYLQNSPKRFDLVISEPSNPWIAGASNLFTREFYEAALRHLERDGMLAQWVQIYSFSAREYALVTRTVTSVFPHCVFVRINAYDTLLLASTTPIAPDATAIQAAQELVDANLAVRGDLERWYGTTDVRRVLLERMLLDERGLRRFLAAVGGETINTDANLRLEFDAALRLFHARGNPAVETNTLLLRSMDIAWQRDLMARFGADASHVDALRGIKTLLFQHSVVPQGRALVDLALAYDPDDAELLADLIIYSPEFSKEDFALEAARVIKLSPREGYRLASSLASLGQKMAVVVVLEELVAALPTSATAWSALGLAYRAIDKPEESERALSKARELDPLDDSLIKFDMATEAAPKR